MNQDFIERISDDEDENHILDGGEIDYLECGGCHTFLVTKRGQIFVTGLNTNG